MVPSPSKYWSGDLWIIFWWLCSSNKNLSHEVFTILATVSLIHDEVLKSKESWGGWRSSY